MNFDSEIVIVSGLPRSGTSLMMQMLHVGGVEVVADNIRVADVDNPRGYLEFETAKRIERDASWLPETRGKAFKMVSQLLYHLPATEQYRIVFMQRDLDEVLASQERMLQRRSATGMGCEQMRKAFTLHLEKLFEWLGQQPNVRLLVVDYSDVLSDASGAAVKVSEFLGRTLVIDRMAAAVDPSLYRNRKAAARV
jgi:hypothetical protein